MSDFEDSTVTYTTVSSLYEGRSGDVSPGVDGPPVMPEDPYAYVVAAFQALPPLDYVPGPEEPEQAPPSPVYIPYVPEPVYPEYIPPEDDIFPAEEQPLPAAASPTTDLPGYIPKFDPEEDHEEQDEDDDDEEEDAEMFLVMPIPLPSPLTPLSSPLPQIPSPLLPASPPILPIPLPAASPPLQLLSSDRRADRPEVTLPPRKRLNIVHCPGYEAGESSVAAGARPMEGHRENYGFVDSVEAEIRRQRAEDTGYGIRDTWIDPRDVAEEEALTTLEGVNTRVTELAAVQEQDTQDIYGVIEDTQGRQTEIFQRVEALVDDSQYHYETGRLGHLATTLGEIRALQAREQARAENGTKESGPKENYKELALLCVQTCLEESDRVERYIGGLPDKFHGSVAASKPKTMQEATEMATGLMDKK
nr:hypothetical protein [Tanacetum cinerariifolium]